MDATPSRCGVDHDPGGRSDGEDLPLVVRAAGRAGDVLAASAACNGRRSTARAPWPSTANGGAACCCARSSASGRPPVSSLPRRRVRQVASIVRCLQRGPPRVALLVHVTGSSASWAPHSEHSPGQSSRHTGWNGSASTTASRSTGSRSRKSPSSRAGLARRRSVLVGVVRTAPGTAPPARRTTGSRQRTHSPSTCTRAVPDTSTPSTTDSSRSSSSTSDPSGTPITSDTELRGSRDVPLQTERIDPGRRPRSRVSTTNGARGSSLDSLASAGHRRTTVPDETERSGYPSAGTTGKRRQRATRSSRPVSPGRPGSRPSRFPACPAPRAHHGRAACRGPGTPRPASCSA